jgi:hypothetical protein
MEVDRKKKGRDIMNDLITNTSLPSAQTGLIGEAFLLEEK